MDYRRDTEIQQAQTRDRKRREKTHALQAQAGDSADTHILQTQLKQYAERGLYPFHMPGHKRLMQPAPDLPAGWDVTEVPGTDDLHDADGILLQAMRRTARLCGADRTWYLVNGSTCGLLAGIRALAPMGAEVICARNCHKAVYHAIELSGYRVHWIIPPVDEEWGICGGISAGQKRRLREVVTANGRSFSDPVLDANGFEDMDASRRVVFKFRMTDEQMIQQLKNIMENGGE